MRFLQQNRAVRGGQRRASEDVRRGGAGDRVHYKVEGSDGEWTEAQFKDSDGLRLILKSGYRSYGTQKTTYANYLARNNGVDDGISSPPGASEHQTGMACDVLSVDYNANNKYMNDSFYQTPEAQWMEANCNIYGFILRYPSDKEDITQVPYEPWHLRYVGREIASYVTANSLSLEEFTEQWQEQMEAFVAAGGNVEQQMLLEATRRANGVESTVTEEYGEDGDAEISLTFLFRSLCRTVSLAGCAAFCAALFTFGAKNGRITETFECRGQIGIDFMGKTVAITNQKGGVGKTTTAINLAACLAEVGKKILLIDLDPQGNSTSGLGMKAGSMTVYEALMGSVPLGKAIAKTGIPHLFLAPADIRLAGADLELKDVDAREYRLKRIVQTIEGDYDFIFIDCPPSLGLLTVNALTAAQRVLIPIQCEYYALEGVTSLLNSVNRVKHSFNPGLDIEACC
jgi:chromosome partitioning protein